MDEERTRLQKILLVLLAAMIVLFAILTGVSRAHKGVLFQESLLQKSESGGQTTYAGKLNGERVTIAVRPEEDATTTVEYTSDTVHDIYQMEYPLTPIPTERGMVDGIRILKNGSVLFEGAYDRDASYGWYDRDGQWDPGITITVSTGTAAGAPAGLDQYDVAYFADGPGLTARGSWGLYFIMVLFTLLVMLDVAFPRLLFYLQHCCDVRDPEPSDFYLAMQKVSWAVYPFLLLLGYIWALRQFP